MPNQRILIVDDSAAIRQVIFSLLKSEGYEPVQAGSGEAGLGHLRNAKFDLVLSDWNMPKMNGSEFVSAIRATDKTIPIVMVTAEAEKSTVLGMRELGVNGYIIKPFKPDALLSVVKKFLG